MSSEEGTMAAVRAELADGSIGLRLRDRYRIVAPVGRGTLGDVSVAEDEVTGERVAVRLLPRELSAEAVQRSRRSIIAASAAAYSVNWCCQLWSSTTRASLRPIAQARNDSDLA